MKKDIDLIKLSDEYNDLRLQFEAFLESMKNEILKILSDAEINLAFPIQLRTKSWDSIREKIERVPITIRKITDMQDLCGIRIVLLFSRDAETVIKKIEEQLHIVKTYNTSERLENDQFGYSSTHIIAQFPDEWLNVPTLRDFKNLKVEIQIRTLSQHLWSEASNLLQYKKEQSIPNVILRSVSRVSALLETVDLEFERVLQKRETYRTDVKANIGKNHNAELNVDLLEQILDHNLPLKNKGANESYADLIRNLRLVNISTTQALEEFIKRNIEHALAEEKRNVISNHEKLKQNRPIDGTSVERVLQGVFYLHTGLVRMMISKEAGVPWNKIDER